MEAQQQIAAQQIPQQPMMQQQQMMNQQQPMPAQQPQVQRPMMPQQMMKHMPGMPGHFGHGSPFDIHMPTYPEFTAPFDIGCGFLKTNLGHLWGSPTAVQFGEGLRELEKMKGELDEIHFRQAYVILESIKPQINNYEELKAKLDRAIGWKAQFHNLHGFFGLQPEVVEKKFLFFKTRYTGMNKEKAGWAMNRFNQSMQESLKALDSIANKQTISFDGLPGTYDNYGNDILEFRNRVANKVDELNNIFGAALNTEVDNPLIGKNYEIINSSHDEEMEMM